MSGARHWEQDKEATVYIGNLDERVSDALVWELMLQAGRIVRFHICLCDFSGCTWVVTDRNRAVGECTSTKRQSHADAPGVRFRRVHIGGRCRVRRQDNEPSSSVRKAHSRQQGERAPEAFLVLGIANPLGLYRRRRTSRRLLRSVQSCLWAIWTAW